MLKMDHQTRILHTQSTLNVWKIISNQQLNLKHKFDYEDTIKHKFYTAMDAQPADTPLWKFCGDQGGIFNLEFSKDGRYVAAACEKESVLLFDANNQMKINMIRGAHSACVNNVRFLDDHSFVTCSDEANIKLWDLRKLTEATSVLLGHSNWVKNIDYIEEGKLLVTSGLDGHIYVWDLHECTETNVYYESLLLLHGITRSRITPDHKKLILCTTGGYLIIVHDLDMMRLCTELTSFRPNVYRLMQISEQTYPCSAMFSHLFNQKRTHNRIEFVDDFPVDAEIITSLQIHPMGWSAVTRTLNPNETEEWTAVHDIQNRDPKEYANAYKYVDDTPPPDEEPETTLQRPTDIWIGFTTQQQLSYFREQQVPFPMEGNHASMGIINSGLIGFNIYSRQFRNRPEDRNRIVMTVPRLTHYRKENLVAKSFIKEMCFSNDGRIICSPHNRGIRLLGFNEKTEEMCYSVPEQPKELYEISVMDNYHSNFVLSSKFSPVHYQLVTGCCNGEIVWFKPLL